MNHKSFMIVKKYDEKKAVTPVAAFLLSDGEKGTVNSVIVVKIVG